MSNYTYFPRNATLTRFQDQLDKTFWISEEIDYSSDRIQMRELENLAMNPGRQSQVGYTSVTSEQAKNIIAFVHTVLAMFAQLDGVVIENLLQHFTDEVSEGEKEIQGFYISQAHNELMHSKSYSVQIETLVTDPDERKQIYETSLKYAAVKKIQDWTFKWFDTSLPIMERLVAFCCIEGIVFTSGFVAIYRLKEWGLFTQGLCKANEFISKDEGVHTEAGIAFFHHKATKGYKKPSPERVYEIVQDSVKLSSDFTNDAVKPELIGLDREDMHKYIQVTANKLLTELGYEKQYDAVCPFEWMNKIATFNMSKMFEEDMISEYQRAGDDEEDDSEVSEGW